MITYTERNDFRFFSQLSSTKQKQDGGQFSNITLEGSHIELERLDMMDGHLDFIPTEINFKKT